MKAEEAMRLLMARQRSWVTEIEPAPKPRPKPRKPRFKPRSQRLRVAGLMREIPSPRDPDDSRMAKYRKEAL